MSYTLTCHAREMCRARGIEQKWIEIALRAPQWIEPDEVDPALEHRFAVIHEFGDRVLRVIVNQTTEPERVITAFFDRRLRGAR